MKAEVRFRLDLIRQAAKGQWWTRKWAMRATGLCDSYLSEATMAGEIEGLLDVESLKSCEAYKMWRFKKETP